MKRLFIISAIFALGATFASAQQSCTATTASVIGTYTYTATEFPLGTVAMTPPGTTTGTTTSQQPYSNTQIGTLLQALNGGAAFTNANVLYFDGAGHISVASSSSSFTATTVVGTYAVNSDCTISVTLMDVFNTTSNAVGANATQGTSTLIGLVVAGGAEVYLSQAQSTSSTNGNTPLVTGQFASRLSIQLVRTYAYACTAANLTGSYGLIGHGYVLVTSSASTGTGTGGTGGTGTGTGGTGTGTGTSTTSSTVQPVALLGVVTFDGAGNLIQETVASGSPLGSFQYKGTYTLNLDCAGTMTLTPASSSTTTTTTGTGTTTSSSSALTVNFVLTPPITFLTTSAYSASPSGNASRPGLAFNLMSSTETLFGTGIAQ